ncbi:uncharacterized protein G2W53_041437 [Senna tora]|uniref:Uncharacterized protein n=1 Tax=Senna tora TaxID=362788 RepID=A0A834W1D6_9FABA|nr:uncharacterized protein G2W53_041437 [Senna tora]
MGINVGGRIPNTYSTVLEAKAVRCCMELAMDWGYEDVIFETDAQIVKIDAQVLPLLLPVNIFSPLRGYQVNKRGTKIWKERHHYTCTVPPKTLHTLYSIFPPDIEVGMGTKVD